MSERFVSGISAKIALYKYSSFPFLLHYDVGQRELTAHGMKVDEDFSDDDTGV